MNRIREVERINEQELRDGVKASASWHQDYVESAWIRVNNLDYRMSEGDVMAVFAQFGETDDIYLFRDRKTGKSQGFGFLKYEDQRSTVLAVDNMTSVKILGRPVSVDHCRNYKLPREETEKEEEVDSENMQAAPPAVRQRVLGYKVKKEEPDVKIEVKDEPVETFVKTEETDPDFQDPMRFYVEQEQRTRKHNVHISSN